jgi:DNA-binding NarL/FixJ family response regulator
MVAGEPGRGEAVAEGWVALGEGEWTRARSCFEDALAAGEAGEALEGLGWAGYCLDDEALTFDARERAYRVYREAGEDRSAARVAAWLASDSLEFRGEPAVAGGWLQRAHRLLDDLEPGADHGWLWLHEGAIALGMHEDTATARKLGAQAAELGRRFTVPELEMLGLGLEGRALVSDGEVDQGMRCLDEASAAALAGDVSLLACAAWACCYLLAACERVRDYERAAQWCVRVGEFCDRYGIVLYRGVCRVHYAGVLTGQGRWAQAEDELSAAAETLAASRPPMTGDALARLGELRRRQGRTAEAEQVFERCENHSISLLGRAAIALDDDRPAEAVELADRYLRRFPDRNKVERCTGLEIAVRARVRIGDEAGAGDALVQLQELASSSEAGSLRAAALAAQGVVLAAAGDHDRARRSCEDALDLLLAGGASFDAARIRLELATALSALGRDDPARRQREAALAAFRRLGANRDAARAEEMLAGPRVVAGARGASGGPLAELSKRELEVLALLAEGLTNPEIAQRLVISEHTAHRHVSNILRKLGVSSRAAAASLAGRHGLHLPEAR